jgi:hypothetical protein
MAAKTGRFKLNGKDYLFEMNVRRSIVVDLVGGLDNNGNCEVGLYEVNGVPLRNQMATAMYEIYVRQEWARANDLTGTIKLSEYLMGTTTDRTLVDSGEGTYVWDHSQDACPDTLVSLYRGRMDQGANQLYGFLHGWHSHRGRQGQEPGRRSGVEGDHDTVRTSGTDDAYLEHHCVLPPHGAD